MLKRINNNFSQFHIFSVSGDLLTSAEVSMRSIITVLILLFRGTSSAKNKPKYDMIGQIQVIMCAILLPLLHKIITKNTPLK